LVKGDYGEVEREKGKSAKRESVGVAEGGGGKKARNEGLNAFAKRSFRQKRT